MENPFTIILSKIEELNQSIKKMSNQFTDTKPQASDLGGIDLACEITGLKRSSIYALTSKRLIPHFHRGKRLYFSRLNLEMWLKDGKVSTVQEQKSNLRIGKGK
ncbi:MAG: helix-turn-helix domain-containing protein [Bacteroidota bacterium]